VMIVDNMRSHYDLVCLKDQGRWCNVVAARRAMQLDPDGKVYCPHFTAAVGYSERAGARVIYAV